MKDNLTNKKEILNTPVVSNDLEVFDIWAESPKSLAQNKVLNAASEVVNPAIIPPSSGESYNPA